MYRVWIEPENGGHLVSGAGSDIQSPVLTLLTDAKGRQSSDFIPQVLTKVSSQRARIIATIERIWQHDAPGIRSLIEHALRQAGESDLLLGETPETWSPAGEVNFASLGTWMSKADLAVVDVDSPFGGFKARSLSSLSPCLVVEDKDGEPLSVVAVSNDAFLAVLPPGANKVRVSIEEQPIGGGVSTYADCPPWEEMAVGVPDAERRELLVWRLYRGRNSQIIDGCSEGVNGAHRLLAELKATAGVLVGRYIRLLDRKARREVSDPFLEVRRQSTWNSLPKETREIIKTSAPPLHQQTRVRGGLVVAVHGTQSTGFHLAASISGLWTDEEKLRVPITRYEHDTWHRLEANATELVERLIATGASHLVLVAHSRGGLVATRALSMLAEGEAKAPATLVTLGSPFLGTPMAHIADATWASLHALMGALRPIAGPIIDAVTRILSWTIKRDPPEGIRLMYPSSDVLPSLRATLPREAFLVGGQTQDERRDYWGSGRGFRLGMGSEVFDGEDNDMVVATASSLAGRETGLIVSSDHSSYMLVPEVRSLIKTAINQMPEGFLLRESAQSSAKLVTW